MLKDLCFRLRPVLLGCATYIPGASKWLQRGTGGSDSARYCYSVWLRHVVMARDAGVWNSPRYVAELGPGDSLGIGLAALLTGAERYHAFDVIDYTDLSRNLSIFDELVELIGSRIDIPGAEEFPAVKPLLADYRFPADVFSDEHLAKCLAPERVARLRSALQSGRNTECAIQFVVPWMVKSGTTDDQNLPQGKIDMIWSQAVLEHVDDLDLAYESMSRWLHPRGFMSHQIDFKSHGLAPSWDGHWQVGPVEWRLARGNRLFLINRQPCSEHLRQHEAHEFELLTLKKAPMAATLARQSLAREFQNLSEDDRSTSGLYVLSRPRANQQSVAKLSCG